MPVATYAEAFKEYARNAGADDPERAWILTPWDTWERNPSYLGPPQPHPEDDYGYPWDEEGRGMDEMEARGGPCYHFRIIRPSAAFADEIPF